MNDPVIERIAREDPAAGSRSDAAEVLLARLRREIDADHLAPARLPVGRRLTRVAAPATAALVAVAVSVIAVGTLGHRSRPSPPGRARRASGLRHGSGIGARRRWDGDRGRPWWIVVDRRSSLA